MSVLGATDPLWMIQAKERARYEEQFKSLNPENGVVTGEQAKGFFLQSQLPPNILGQIWALSDTDSDGRMDINEFSIACKLINLKLRGYQIPAVLPPALKNLDSQFPPAVNSGMPMLNISVLPQAVTSLKSQTMVTSPGMPSQPFVGAKSGIASTVAPLLPVDPIVTAVPMVLRPNITGNAQISQTMQVPINVSQTGVNQNLADSQSSSFPPPTVGNQAISTQVMVPAIPQVASVVSQVPSVIPQVQPVISQTLPGIPQPTPAISTPGAPQILPITQQVTSDGAKIIERKQSIDSL